jgi:ferrochelatase
MNPSIHQKKGVLLVNLGTPQKAEKKEVRLFLKEFLADPRVLDIPAWGRWLLLNLLILPFRPQKIIPKYKLIWGENGSPLKVHSNKLLQKLQRNLGEEYQLELVMRYGTPSIAEGLKKMRKNRVTEILIWPLFPQYASATTGSVLENVYQIVGSWLTIPELKTINWFYQAPEMLKIWVGLSRSQGWGKPDHILFSYHGLPERQIKNSAYSGGFCLQNSSCCSSLNFENITCYRAQCFENSRLLAEQLNCPPQNYSTSFQSRLGRDNWITPATTATVKKLAKEGIKNLLVFSPSFVTDCLETIEELGIQERKNFLAHGGENFRLVPSLNSDNQWADFLTATIQNKLS